jgi:hypothetical protein
MSYQVLEEGFDEQEMIDARPKFWVGEETGSSADHHRFHHRHSHKVSVLTIVWE